MKTIEFKSALVRATFAPNRALDFNIGEVELGVFGELSRELINRTLSDSLRREHLYTALVTSSEKVLVNKEAVLGEESLTRHTFTTEIDMNMLFQPNKRLRQDKFMGAGLHSHPVDFPPSPTDLTGLMYSDFEPDAVTAAFVITPRRRIVIFRGAKTPGLSRAEAAIKVGLWTRNLEERMLSFDDGMMSDEDYIEMQRMAQDAQINQIVAKYDLALFSGALSESTVRRGLL